MRNAPCPHARPAGPQAQWSPDRESDGPDRHSAWTDDEPQGGSIFLYATTDAPGSGSARRHPTTAVSPGHPGGTPGELYHCGRQGCVCLRRGVRVRGQTGKTRPNATLPPIRSHERHDRPRRF
eukprot:8201427-Pyramimonas_sp.AAC.1